MVSFISVIDLHFTRCWFDTLQISSGPTVFIWSQLDPAFSFSKEWGCKLKTWIEKNSTCNTSLTLFSSIFPSVPRHRLSLFFSFTMRVLASADIWSGFHRDRLTGNEEVEGATETGAGVQHSLFGQRYAAMSFTAAPHRATLLPGSLTEFFLSPFLPSHPFHHPPFSSWVKRTMQSITQWHARTWTVFIRREKRTALQK